MLRVGIALSIALAAIVLWRQGKPHEDMIPAGFAHCTPTQCCRLRDTVDKNEDMKSPEKEGLEDEEEFNCVWSKR